MKKSFGWRALIVLSVLLFLSAAGGMFWLSTTNQEVREFSFESEAVKPCASSWKEENGQLLYTKEYVISEAEHAESLPRDPFLADGIRWEFWKVETEPERETRQKAYTHTVTFESGSNDMKTLIGMLDQSKQITTEDGYQGTVYLDASSIRAEAKGYRSVEVPVRKTRTYAYLASQDLSYVPKQITEQGVSCPLKSVSWQIANVELLDDYPMANCYHAVATYEGHVRRMSATGYLVTASYQGTVEKEEVKQILCRMLFRGERQSPLQWLPVRYGLGVLFALVLLMAALFLMRRFRIRLESEKTIEERW